MIGRQGTAKEAAVIRPCPPIGLCLYFFFYSIYFVYVGSVVREDALSLSDLLVVQIFNLLHSIKAFFFAACVVNGLF